MSLSVEARVALISGAFAIGAAGASAVISVIVSNNQIAAAREKLEIEDRVARAELFKSLIKDFEKEGTANYALLALWQLYKDKNDRNIIVLAALQNPDQKTLQMLRTFGLQNELEPYIEQIEGLLKHGGKASVAARELLLDIDPTRYLGFLLKDLQGDANVSFVDDRITQIRTILTKDPALEKVVSDSLDRNKSNYTTIALALYVSGNQSALRDQIDAIKSDPTDKFHRVATIVASTEVQLEERDRKALVDAALKATHDLARTSITSNSEEAAETAINMLKRFPKQLQDLSSGEREQLVNSLELLFLHQDLQDKDLIRADVASVMFTMDRESAVMAYALAKACNNSESLMDTLIGDSIENARMTKPDLPRSGASTEKWRNWARDEGRQFECL